MATVLEGYKGFGSFHSDNVEELIRIPDDDYVPPSLPASVAGIHAALEVWEPAPFGAEHRRRFMLEDDCTFVNHGAFGAPLRSVIAPQTPRRRCVLDAVAEAACHAVHRRVAFDAASAWRIEQEGQPVRFVDRVRHCAKTPPCAAWGVGEK